MEPRLKQVIFREINPSLKEMFGYKSLFMGPKIQKIIEMMSRRLPHTQVEQLLNQIEAAHFSGAFKFIIPYSYDKMSENHRKTPNLFPMTCLSSSCDA